MTNVTPIAETGPSPAQPEVFTWTFAGAPLRIQIPLAIVAQLRNELSQIETSLEAGNHTESGGVLLGRQTNAATLEIDEYRWLLSEREHERRFSLDLAVLKRMRSNPSAASQVVGYFRTQNGDALRLRGDELRFVKEHFPERSSVVLLIDTKAKPYNAGFFFWMETNVFAPFSLRDFPLDPEILALQKKSPAGAHRRLPVAVEPREEAEEIDGEAETEADGAAGTLTYVAPAVHAPDLHPAPGHTPDLIGPSGMDAAMGAPERNRFPVKAVGLGLALLALSGIAMLNWGGRKQPAASAPVPVAESSLHLEVEEQGGGLNVRWNTHSDVVQQAAQGSLEVQEDNQLPQVIPLDPDQLESGHVYYRSSGQRLQFGLAIVDKAGKITRESVLALSSKAVATSQVPAQASPAAAVSQRVTPQQPPAFRGLPVQTANAEPPAKRPAPARVFNPPARKGAGALPSITIDQAPAVATNTPPPAIGLPTALNKLPAPPVIQLAATAPGQPLVISGNVEAANLVKGVAPIYPQSALAGRVQGVVRFTALIGKDGSVRNLQTISGNPALVAAAAEAVKQWVYRPTVQNGAPVEVLTQIDINFTLNR